MDTSNSGAHGRTSDGENSASVDGSREDSPGRLEVQKQNTKSRRSNQSAPPTSSYSYRTPEYRAYHTQRAAAKRRGIKFHFTLDEWVAWWESKLGPDWFSKRGGIVGKHVMGRIGDQGPYAPHNVRCITMSENSAAAGGWRGRPDIQAKRKLQAALEQAAKATAP